MTRYDFKRVYEQNRELVWNLVAKYVFDRRDREDLFQEIFFRVHQALPKFRGDAALPTWIYRISVNLSLNYLKRQERYARLKQALAWSGFFSEKTEEQAVGGEELGGTLEHGRLAGPLSKLTPRQRLILILADVEEKRLEEVAQVLKLPLGTVKSNLFRARENIRKELRGNDGL